MLKAVALLILAGLAIVMMAGLGFAIVSVAWPYLLGLSFIVVLGVAIGCTDSDDEPSK